MENTFLEKTIELLEEIKNRLVRIEADIQLLKEENKIVSQNCLKMGTHIDFVEKTYEVVRSPLNYLKKKIEFVIGSSTQGELLSICQ